MTPAERKAKRVAAKRKKEVQQSLMKDFGFKVSESKGAHIGPCDECGHYTDVRYVFRLRQYLCKNHRKDKDSNI